MPIWSAEIKELEKIYESFKGQLPDLGKELERLIRADDENMVLLYARRCLEVIVTDLCESELKRPRKTEPLKGIIDKLSKEEKVPSHIITSMDHLNSLSTYGAHPKDFDPEQVRPILLNLGTIIKWYLKFKDNRTDSKSGTEELKPEGTGWDDSAKNKQKPKNRLILLVSSLLLACIIVVIALFFFDIIGSDKHTRTLDKSIAVLPFINDSPDEENLYFINGIMEEILNNLQTIQDLRVISRSSVEQYRGSARPTSPEIAKKLDVNYIVEGSGQKYGNTFRLRVQLIEAMSDRHLWARSYEQSIEKTNDIFNIQSDIAHAIANELKAIITPEEKKIIEKIPTENLEAYQDYLLGLHYNNKGGEENLLKAIEYCKNAIHKDPEFALAFTRIAWAYMGLIFDANWLPEDVYPKAKEVTLKALNIDNNLSEAHNALADIKLYYDWDFKEAEKEYQLAIALNPNNASAYFDYAHFLYISCHFMEALERSEKALSLDPNSETMKFMYGFYLYQAFRNDSAILILKKGVEKYPNSPYLHYLLGYVCLQDGDYMKSIEHLERAIELDPIPQPYYLYLGVAYNKAGKPGETRKILEKLNALEKENKKVSFGKAILYSELGETDQAIHWLEEAYEERHQYIIFLKCVPIMCSSIRSDPGFQEIYHKIWPDD